jgi:hypothetical protein
MSFSGNTFATTQYILDETFIRFINYLNFAKVANRNLEGDFKGLKYATGQTINYRLEERYLGGYGATATSEARVQVVRPLTIDTQFHTMVEFSGFELTFDRARDQPYLDMMLNPRAKRLANMVEQFIAQTNFQLNVWQAYGAPGTPIDFNTVLQTDAYMTQLGIPEDGNRYWANPPAVSATLTNDLYTVFNMTVNRGALLDGFIGHLSGFDFFKTNFLIRQIAGTPGATGGTPPSGYVAAGTVANGPITGGNTIELSGLASTLGQVLFNVGDILTLDAAAGVYMVVANGSATTYNVPVNPTIVISGARQNISAAIPNGAQVYLATSHNVSLAFHNQAIVFAAPPIKELKGGVEAVTSYSDLYKMAMTYSLGADIRNYVQLDRIDIIAGVEINGEFAVVVMS